METFEFVLILLACIIASAPFDQVLQRLALPLIQVAIGFVAALFLPEVADVRINSELFLALFIAPLLFNDAREAVRADLFHNLAGILSMAIGLVMLIVLVVGFALHWLVPSIPLAAAFACAGALGPTDAAAVGALGSTVSLSKRQKTLLTGEALINDASGVVSFQFAIAAVVTGGFSAAEAGASFLVLFFGGMFVGIVIGLVAVLSAAVLRRHGFENTVVHVLYEVLTPFVVFLAAEGVGVSGILAVVATGLIMANSDQALLSATEARQQVLSSGVWEVLVFLINGSLFTLLGMQLPRVMSPTFRSEYGLAQLAGTICAMTVLVILVRFVWVTILELLHKDPETGERGLAHPARSAKESLVTTLAGPKGAVTLSIILTIPQLTADGSFFPCRNLIIFLTAGTILMTLIAANVFLPLLSEGGGEVNDEAELNAASIAVLSATLERIRSLVAADEHAEYVPALRLVAARYRSRLFRERMQFEGFGDTLGTLMDEVLDVQQRRADEIQGGPTTELSVWEAAPYYAMLRGIRGSVGYMGDSTKVGARFDSLAGRLALLWEGAFPTRIEGARAERIYYDTCLFAIDLERAAIDYLEGVIEEGDWRRAEVAQVLVNEHRGVVESLWGRINYGQDAPHDPDMEFEHGIHDELPEGMQETFGVQFQQARQHADEADALALGFELEEVQRLRAQGIITKQQAHELRESVYLMQMTLGE
ncbi:MAG: sodium:proton antiporter [Atopobiaceae bacterium]|nr:sodium:proton antiporter [Atopobiaceae bacterium]